MLSKQAARDLDRLIDQALKKHIGEYTTEDLKKLNFSGIGLDREPRHTKYLYIDGKLFFSYRYPYTPPQATQVTINMEYQFH